MKTPKTQEAPNSGFIAPKDWMRLILLSILWGGSFIFIGAAVTELSSLVIVFARVAIAAAVLLPVHVFLAGSLPRDPRTWFVLGTMSLFNNVIPFSLIVYGQHSISSGLASVLNATTPLFGAVIMALAGVESLTPRKNIGLVLGVLGVAVLRGFSVPDLGRESIGMIAILLASASYAVSGLWAKKKLSGIKPLTSATCQLLVSSVLMSFLVFAFDNPASLLHASKNTWLALIGLAVVSTAVAYLIFFRIVASAGPSVVLLVTMLIPMPAVAMGAAFLGEPIILQHILGALIIGAGLVIIDGRLPNLLAGRRARLQ